MKVIVDEEKCQGHLRCVLLAPELFRSNDMGHSEALHEEVPPDLEGKAEQAVENCPEEAIRIER